MWKTNFWFPFKGTRAVSGKEEQPQIFLPSPRCAAISAEEHFPSPWQWEEEHNLALLEDLLHKAAQRFWFPTTHAAVLGLPLGSELPWDTWTSSPQNRVFLPSTPLVLLKMTKSNKKHFGGMFEGEPIPPPKAAATDGEGRAGGAWLPAGAWAKYVLGQLGWLRGSSLQWHPAESVLGAWISKLLYTFSPLFSPHFQTQNLIATLSIPSIPPSSSPTCPYKAAIIFPTKQRGYLPAVSSASPPNNIFSLDISPFLSDLGPGGG